MPALKDLSGRLIQNDRELSDLLDRIGMYVWREDITGALIVNEGEDDEIVYLTEDAAWYLLTADYRPVGYWMPAEPSDNIDAEYAVRVYTNGWAQDRWEIQGTLDKALSRLTRIRRQFESNDSLVRVQMNSIRDLTYLGLPVTYGVATNGDVLQIARVS